MIIKEAKQAHVEILLKVCYDIYQQYEWLSSAYIAVRKYIFLIKLYFQNRILIIIINTT